jgi:hypothetical protein
MSIEEMREAQVAVEQEAEELQSRDKDARQYELLLEKAKAKAAHVEQVRAAVATLKEDAAEEDRQARGRERDAAAHDLQVAAAVDQHTALQKRRVDAEERRGELLGSIDDRERKRGLVVEQREQIRKRREEEERVSDELDKVEHELARDEQQFAAEKQREADAEATAKRELEEAGRVVEKPKDKVTEFLDKYEEKASGNGLKVERLERLTAQRKATLDMEQSRWTALWKVKHEDVEAAIRELTQRLHRAQNLTILNTKAADLEREREDLLERIEAQEAELKEIQGPLDEILAQIAKLQSEANEEREKLAQQERRLDEQQLRNQIETFDSESQVEDMRARKIELSLLGKVAEARGTAAQRVLDLYQNQLAAAEQRASLLAVQRESLQGDPHSSA